MYLIRSAYMGKQNISTFASPGRAFYILRHSIATSCFLFGASGMSIYCPPPQKQHLPGAVWPIRWPCQIKRGLSLSPRPPDPVFVILVWQEPEKDPVPDGFDPPYKASLKIWSTDIRGVMMSLVFLIFLRTLSFLPSLYMEVLQLCMTVNFQTHAEAPSPQLVFHILFATLFECILFLSKDHFTLFS